VKQSRIDSFMEALTNTIIGLLVSTVANATLTPAVLGRPITLIENVVLSAGFTAISIARSYILRRLFNGRPVWQAIKKFATKPGRGNAIFGYNHPGDAPPDLTWPTLPPIKGTEGSFIKGH
jgi:hypothetical protein